MKRNLILLAVVLALAALAFYFFSGKQDAMGELMKDRDFTIENVDDIAKIFIARKGQPAFTFHKRKGSWYINNENKASQNAMQGILNFFKRNQIKFIPSKNATQNIIKEIGILGIKVEAYDGNDRLLKSFYIGGNTPDERGTYFLMENATQPYVLEMPGEVSVLREKFMRTPGEWRDKALFEFTPEDIAKVSVEYPKNKNHSFILKNEGSKNVLPYYENAVQYFENPSEPLMDAYIEEFDLIYGEAVDNTHWMRDSVSQMVPFAVISVETKAGVERSVRLISFNDAHQLDHKELTELENMAKVERFYAETSWGDFYVVQLRLIKELLRSYAFFFAE